ncbi:MAG: transporter substrate-binding protein, partial [Cyanobacteriota bacterium]|nr:transporter substrate-binding protein [Cyanobacteriota bacterium]
QPDVVFNTLNGDSNLAFYQQYQAARITARDIPIMAVSIAEGELQRMENPPAGHYAAWSYFQSINTPKNQAFVRAFQRRYGRGRVTSDPIEAAYTQVYLWQQAVTRARALEVDAVRRAARGQDFEAPGGWVRVEANHHLWKDCYIGRILPTGQFEIVSASDRQIEPLPWLGIEKESSAIANVVVDLLREVPQGIQYSWDLEQQSARLDRQNREMAGYIERVQQITEAAAAVEQDRFDPKNLAAIADRNDDLGQLARVMIRMVETAKTRERELAEAQEQLKAVLNAVPGSISWLDSDGVYLGVNRHLADQFNLTEDTFMGKEVGFLKGSSKLAAFLRNFVVSSEPSATSVLDIEVNETTRYYLVAAQKYQQGGATVSVGIDITERKLAEEALQQSEARNRALLNAIPDLMVEVSREGIYLDSIEAKDGRWVLRDRQNRVGRSVRDVLPAEVAQQYLQAIEQVLQKGQPLTLVYEFQLEDEMQTFEARVTACRENSALFLVRNISDRKQAEAALVKSEERFRSLVANIPGAIYRSEYDPDRTMEYISDAIESISGYPASDFIQNQERSYASIIHPDDLDFIEVVVSHAMVIEEPYVLDYRILHRDGKIRWVYEQGQVVFDADGNPLYLDGAIFNMTERKQAEDALRIAEENYRSIFENALEGIFQSSPEGQFISVNPALAKIYGYDSPADMIASITNIGEQLYVDSEKRIEFRELLKKQDTVKDFEYRCYCKDGDIIWTQIDARAVKDSQGNVLYYEGIVQDISDRKRREDELRKQLEELKIEIDQKKREKEVAMLTESSYFQEVQQEMSELDLDEFWS